MLHSFAALLQFFLLACGQVGISQLLILELQKVKILAVAFYCKHHLAKFFLYFKVFGISVLILSELRCIVGNNINHLKLEVLLVKQQILVLRVYIHQLVAKLLQHR